MAERKFREKRTRFQEIVLRMFLEKSEITVKEVALAAGFSEPDDGERKAILRVLNSFIKNGSVSIKGSARARVYVRHAKLLSKRIGEAEAANPFKDIPLSDESQNLLEYVSRPIRARIPVGYNQEFLRSYNPNFTFYLSDLERSERKGVV